MIYKLPTNPNIEYAALCNGHYAALKRAFVEYRGQVKQMFKTPEGIGDYRMVIYGQCVSFCDMIERMHEGTRSAGVHDYFNNTFAAKNEFDSNAVKLANKVLDEESKWGSNQRDYAWYKVCFDEVEKKLLRYRDALATRYANNETGQLWYNGIGKVAEMDCYARAYWAAYAALDIFQMHERGAEPEENLEIVLRLLSAIVHTSLSFGGDLSRELERGVYRSESEEGVNGFRDFFSRSSYIAEYMGYAPVPESIRLDPVSLENSEQYARMQEIAWNYMEASTWLHHRQAFSGTPKYKKDSDCLEVLRNVVIKFDELAGIKKSGGYPSMNRMTLL